MRACTTLGAFDLAPTGGQRRGAINPKQEHPKHSEVIQEDHNNKSFGNHVKHTAPSLRPSFLEQLSFHRLGHFKALPALAAWCASRIRWYLFKTL